MAFTRGHGTALSCPLKQALSSFQGPLAPGYFISVVLTTSLMIFSCPIFHHQLFDICYLLVYLLVLRNLAFLCLLFIHSASALVLPFLPSGQVTSMFLVGKLSQTFIVLETMKLSVEAKLLEELPLQFMPLHFKSRH